jgi:hypothetical protein
MLMRVKIVFLTALVLCVIAFAMGRYINAQAIRSQADAVVAAQETLKNKN